MKIASARLYGAASSVRSGRLIAAWIAACATNIACGHQHGRRPNIDVTATVAETIALSGDDVVIQGLRGQQARMAGGLTIDPGAVVKLYGTRIEAGFGARVHRRGDRGQSHRLHLAGGRQLRRRRHLRHHQRRQSAAPAAGDWGGIYFGPTSQGSLDHARVFYAGGNVAIEGGFANFAPIDIRQATVRIADSLFQYNTCSTTTDDRNGRGDIDQAAVIYVRFAQPVIVNNVIRDNLARRRTTLPTRSPPSPWTSIRSIRSTSAIGAAAPDCPTPTANTTTTTARWSAATR